MNVRFGSMVRNTGTSIAALILLTTALGAYAGPDQLDILGLIPDESDWSHIKQTGTEINPEKGVQLEIGGHKIPCAVTLANGKLALMACYTGKGTSKYDNWTDASNTEIHATALAGFTKKFGKPDSINKGTVRTRIGVEYVQEFVTWRDKKGNRLRLASIVGAVTAGAITLESAEYLREEEKKDATKESERKF